MLECSNCKRLTHYACTKLPGNQIGPFMLKAYRLYKCSTCVGEIHNDILENCALEAKSNELNQLRAKWKKLEEEKSIQMAKCSLPSNEELPTHKVRQGRKIEGGFMYRPPTVKLAQTIERDFRTFLVLNLGQFWTKIEN